MYRFFHLSFYCDIVNLQCCVSFEYTAKIQFCIHVYALLFRFFSVIVDCKILSNSSVCCIVGLSCLPIFIVCIC